MIVVMAIGCVLYFTRNFYLKLLNATIVVLDGDNRENIIYLIGFIIGILHYFFVTREQKENKNLFVSTSMIWVNSIASAFGYSFILNRGVNLTVGLSKDYFRIEPFFVHPEKVDHLTLLIISLIATYTGGFYLFRMAKQCVVEIAHPTVIPVADMKKNEQDKKS